MFEVSNRADIILDYIVSAFDNGETRIDVDINDPDASRYGELKAAEMIDGIGAFGMPVFVVTGITPKGFEHHNKVWAIKDSWNIPILSKNVDEALRQLNPESPQVDTRYVKFYRQLHKAGLISVFYADSEVYFISEITPRGLAYLRGQYPTSERPIQSTLDTYHQGVAPDLLQTCGAGRLDDGKPDDLLVFISYSWDGEDHKNWVQSFADYLHAKGVRVLIDQELRLGRRFPAFMEQSIAKADYVFVICTPLYKEKADGRTGGVGYESSIISGELYERADNAEEKYIPILRSGNWDTSVPRYMSGMKGVDCRSGVIDDVSLRELLIALGLS